MTARDIAEGYDLIIFDFDGTIARLSVDWAGLKHELSSALGQPFGTLAEGLDALRSTGDARALETYWGIVRRYEWADPAGLTANDEVIAFVRAIRPGRRIAVCSSNAHRTVERGLAQLGIADRVDLVIGGDDVRHAKPHPEGLNAIIARCGAEKSRTLLIGDTDGDREAGASAGVRTVILENGGFPAHA